MKAKQCDMPRGCLFKKDIEKFYCWDSFEVPLRRTDLSMQEIYLGIFAHLPRMFKFLLIIRNAIVSIFGLSGPAIDEINHVEIKAEYAVGEKIARFTLFSQSANEIIAGCGDWHLDFRVSVLRVKEADANRVIVTTVLSVYNLFGKIYLFFIMPFHRLGIKTIMSNAVAAYKI